MRTMLHEPMYNSNFTQLQLYQRAGMNMRFIIGCVYGLGFGDVNLNISFYIKGYLARYQSCICMRL